MGHEEITEALNKLRSEVKSLRVTASLTFAFAILTWITVSRESRKKKQDS